MQRCLQKRRQPLHKTRSWPEPSERSPRTSSAPFRGWRATRAASWPRGTFCSRLGIATLRWATASQSLNFITGTLLMAPLSEEDAFFSLVTIVEDLLPPDYYTRDDDLLGARIDQLVFSELLEDSLPRLWESLNRKGVPLSLVSLQWFMCLFSKDLPLSLVLRVWDVMFVYGDHALFAVGLAMLHMAEAPLLSTTVREEAEEAA